MLQSIVSRVLNDPYSCSGVLLHDFALFLMKCRRAASSLIPDLCNCPTVTLTKAWKKTGWKGKKRESEEERGAGRQERERTRRERDEGDERRGLAGCLAGWLAPHLPHVHTFCHVWGPWHQMFHWYTLIFSSLRFLLSFSLLVLSSHLSSSLPCLLFSSPLLSFFFALPLLFSCQPESQPSALQVKMQSLAWLICTLST